MIVLRDIAEGSYKIISRKGNRSVTHNFDGILNSGLHSIQDSIKTDVCFGGTLKIASGSNAFSQS